MDAQERGRWVWCELLTSQPGPAEDFYREVVGWDVEDWSDAPADQPYHMWMTGHGPIGGVMELPEEARAQGAPPHWLAYVSVENVDDTISRANEMGATVVMPAMDVPNVGRLAILNDPQGAMFAVFKPSGEMPGGAGSPQEGDISWYELATTDRGAALRFYSELFGWTKTDEFDMGEGNLYEMYGKDEQTFGGIFDKPAEMPGPPHWLLYALVDDVSRAVEVAKARGGQVLNGPMEVPGGDRVAQIMDPQGAVFAVHSKSGASA